MINSVKNKIRYKILRKSIYQPPVSLSCLLKAVITINGFENKDYKYLVVLAGEKYT